LSNVEERGVPNILKFFLLVMIFLPIVYSLATRSHKAIEIFEAEGEIIHIEWHSRNHGMPVISIKEKEGIKLFKGNRITLRPEDINVGDYFYKSSNSKDCKINDRVVNCVN